MQHLLTLLALLAFVSARAAERPNIIVIMADDLGALGVAHAKTPRLDSFAKTARVFTHHYVRVPTCGASRCALWRGRYPTLAAQVGNNGTVQTLAEWGVRSLPAATPAVQKRAE